MRPTALIRDDTQEETAERVSWRTLFCCFSHACLSAARRASMRERSHGRNTRAMYAHKKRDELRVGEGVFPWPSLHRSAKLASPRSHKRQTWGSVTRGS